MPEGVDSYGTELGGQIGIASFLEGLQHLIPPGTPPPQVTCCCDGISALAKTGLEPDTVRAKFKHGDLVSILSSLWDSINFTISRRHVYGHQDDSNRNLTLEERLNCFMDAKAKFIARSRAALPHAPTFHRSSLGFGTISINGDRIFSNIQGSIYTHVTHLAYVQRLSTTLEIPTEVLQDSIDWNSFGRARKRCPRSLQSFITKWISNTAATGTVMVARNYRHSAQCPLCPEPHEDVIHVLTCQAPSSSTLRESLLQDLKLWLRSIKTHPDICSFLINGLRSWFLHPFGDEPLHHTVDDQSFTAISSQLDLGWYALLCGYLSKSLIQCQHSYYVSLNSKKHGSTWGHQLTMKLWHLTFSIWKHRNSALHESDAIDRLSGIQLLKNAITSEYTRGQEDLPMPYSPFFYFPLPTLLRKLTIYLKRWFMTVRAGHERFQPNIPYDAFTTDDTLRTWVGLATI